MSLNAGKADLTQGPVGRHLVRLTVPMVWGLLAIISFQLVDMYFVSLLGTKALTAITFTFPITYAIFSLTLAMGIAASSVISRQIGAGNMARARRLTTHALVLAVIVAVFLAVIGMAVMDPLFRAMGVPADIMPMVRSFMTVWFIGGMFINTPVVGNATMRAAGDTMTPALVMTVAAVVNAILDPVLIFGLFGFPQMGMTGAAVATVFANICAMAAGFYIIAVRRRMLSRSRRHWRLLADSAKRMAFIALPAGFAMLLQPAVSAVIIALLAARSHEAVAAFGIANRVESFSFIIIMALATGMAPLIGQNWGARHYARVHQTLRHAFSFAVLWSLVVAVVLGLFARPIAEAFSGDEGVVTTTVLYFLIIPVTYAAGNLAQGWSSAFNAIGMPKRSFFMMFVRLIVLNVPLVVLGAHFYGVEGVFAATALTNVLAGCGFHLWNRRYLRAVAPP